MKTNQKGVALFPQWLKHSVLRIPSESQPSPNAVRRESANFSPLSERLSLTPACDKSIAAGVSGLLLFCRPSAVFGRITSVVIGSIQTVTKWARPHVRKKRFKTVAPPVAYMDSSPAVIAEVGVSVVVASRNHVRPNGVFAGGASSIRVTALTMFKGYLTGSFLLKAAARQSVPGHQVIRPSLDSFSAFAQTVPLRIRPVGCFGFDVFSQADKHQSPELSTSVVFGFFHFFTLKWLTVMGAWQAAVNSFSGATLAKRVAF